MIRMVHIQSDTEPSLSSWWIIEVSWSMPLCRFHIQLLHAGFAHCSGGPCLAYLTWTVLHSFVLKALSAFQDVHVSGCLQSHYHSTFKNIFVSSFTPCLAMSAFSLPCKLPALKHVSCMCRPVYLPAKPQCLLALKLSLSLSSNLLYAGGGDDAGPPARGCFRVSRKDPVLGNRLLPCSNQKFRCPDDPWDSVGICWLCLCLNVQVHCRIALILGASCAFVSSLFSMKQHFLVCA